MNCRRFSLPGLSIVLAAAACTTTTLPLPTAPQLITTAEQQLQAKQYDEVLATLEAIADEQCPKRLRDHRDLLKAQAELGRGQPWQAFLELEEFTTRYPHSNFRGQAIDVIWTAGQALVGSDGGFLFFWSDKRAGRTVLEHLITRHPDSQRLADALRILGDMAFDDGEYDLAQDRYRDIIYSRPDSDWRFYAQFRLAMSLVASLRGPDYDLNRMELATGHLREFLSSNPEGPQMVKDATAALQRVKQWQVQRHMDIADFYKTLNSVEGERYHLRLAASEPFLGVPGYEEALQMRKAFEQAHPPIADATPPGGRP
jgi:outer membrane protein assembly factor BamD (BamD/ComL family)